MSAELVQVTIPNLPLEIKERLEHEATKQDRSLASLLRVVLIEYAQKLNGDEKESAPRKRQPAAA